MKKELDSRPIVLLGDIHGDFNFLSSLYKRFQDLIIIQVGDFGMGFRNLLKEQRVLNQISELFEEKNIELFAIRGNHDDPRFFKDLKFRNSITLLQDYSVLSQNGKSILLVGGGISVDRCLRNLNQGYWKDETFVLDWDSVTTADVLVTHAAPQSFPLTKEDTNGLISDFSQRDRNLRSDLKLEAQAIQKLSDATQAKRHYFGHFHVSQKHVTDSRTYVCVDINELVEMKFE